MSPTLFYGGWVIPGILILMSLYLFFYPARRTGVNGFGKATINITVTHLWVAIPMLIMTGAVVTGVIGYESLSKALAEVKMENNNLVAQNNHFKNQSATLAKLFKESSMNFKDIMAKVGGTKSRIEQASSDLTNIGFKDLCGSNPKTFERSVSDLKVKVVGAKKGLAEVYSKIELQNALNLKITTEIASDNPL